MKIRVKLFQLFWKIIELIPLFLPIAISIYGLWMVTLLLTNKFTTPYLLLGTILLLPSIIYTWKIPPLKIKGSIKEQKVFNILLIGFVLFWCFFNVQFTSKHILADRDPGIYTLSGIWLTDHSTTNTSVERPFGNHKGVVERSVGFWSDDASKYSDKKTHIQPQGMHLIQAFAGLFGKVGGLSLLFATGVIFGGVALLALYSFARQLVKPRWAFLAALIFGASLPLIYFSRDIYTEPLSAALTMSALALIWIAYINKDRVNWSLWLLAGIVSGGSVLVRPDGYLTTIALTFFLIVGIILEKNLISAKRQIISLAVFLLGFLPFTIVSYLDISNLTLAYYIDNRKIIILQIFLLVFLLLTGMITYLISRKTSLIKSLNYFTKNWRFEAVLSVFILVVVFLISRPLWLTVHNKVLNGTTFLVQSKMGLPIEARSYAENSLEWISWYIGGCLLLLTFIGCSIFIKKIFKDNKLIYLGLLTTFLSTSLIYLISPKITPDQIWVIRRFLPVVIPCAIVIGIYALSYIYEKFIDKNYFYKVCFVLGVSAYLILQPLIITRPFIKVAEYQSTYGAFMSFCRKFPANAAVLWLGDNTFALNSVQTTRALCKVESAGYTLGPKKPLNKTKLLTFSEEARKRGLLPYVAVQGSMKPKVISHISPYITKSLYPAVIYHYDKVEQTLLNPPRSKSVNFDSIELGKIEENGQIVSVY